MTPADRRLALLAELTARNAIHRRILAPVAIGIGATALVVAVTLVGRPLAVRALDFELVWLAIAVFGILLLVANLWRSAARREEPPITPRTLLVVTAVLPATLSAAAVSFAAAATHMQPLATSGFWMIFYGLALLASSPFAPRTVPALGWVFLVSGLTLLSVLCSRFDLLLRLDFTLAGYWIMGCTFGLYHLAYGWLTWPGKK